MPWLKQVRILTIITHQGVQQLPQNHCNMSIMCIFLVQGKYHIFHLHLEMIFFVR